MTHVVQKGVRAVGVKLDASGAWTRQPLPVALHQHQQVVGQQPVTGLKKRRQHRRLAEGAVAEKSDRGAVHFHGGCVERFEPLVDQRERDRRTEEKVLQDEWVGPVQRAAHHTRPVSRN